MTIFKLLDGKFERTSVFDLFCSTNQVHIKFSVFIEYNEMEEDKW